MNPNLKPLPGAWLVVALLWCVAALNYLDRMMISTMRESLTAAIPMTDAQFGLLTSIFLWVYSLGNPVAGFIADRFGRSRVIVASVFIWSAVTWLTSRAVSYDQLFWVRGLMGISEAAYIPAALSLIADYHRGSTRSLATGIHLTGVFVGAGFGGLGGYLAERFDWTAAFEIFGALGVVYAIVLAFVLRDPPPEETTAQATDKPSLLSALATPFGSGAFIVLLAMWGLLGWSGWAVLSWMPTYLAEQFNISQGRAGLSATGYIQAAALCGVLIGGAWADRWSLVNPRGRIYVSAIGLFLAAPGVLLAATCTSLNLALVGLVVFGLCKSFTDANLMPILCQIVEQRYRATAYGILNLFNCAVGGLAAYSGGMLRDAQINVSHAFVLAAGSLVICSILLMLVRPHPSPDDPAGPSEAADPQLPAIAPATES